MSLPAAIVAVTAATLLILAATATVITLHGRRLARDLDRLEQP